MRIAFTSSDGVTVDQHFGQTRDFRIWEVGTDSAVEIDTVTALPVSEAPQGAPDSERGFAAGS